MVDPSTVRARLSSTGEVAARILDDGQPTDEWLVANVRHGRLELRRLAGLEAVDWVPLVPFTRAADDHEACAEHAQEVGAIVAALVHRTGADAVQLAVDELAAFTADHAVVITRGDSDGLKIEVRDLRATVEGTTADDEPR